MYNPFIRFLSITMLFLGSLVVSTAIFAEDKAPSIEDMVSKPTGEAITDLSMSESKRAKVTEEQGIAQLKYMMISAFKRVEEDLLSRGSFKPMGMTLDPDGTFRGIRVDGQEDMPQELAVEALVKALKGLASNRTQWAVGITYVTGRKLEDGTTLRQMVVATEHIAGWARSWTYPYVVKDGAVKMGQPEEREMKPVYYQR
jgi:hypothetical protein